MRPLRLLLLIAVLASGGLVHVPAAVADVPSRGSVTLRTPWKGAWRRPPRPPVVVAPISSPSTPSPVPAPVSDLVAFVAQVVTLVDRERAAVGLPGLRASTCASGFAQRWSQQMATSGVFEHQSLAPMLTGCAARGAGENIAYGARTPEELMSMWMASPGHRANILRPSFTHLGVGLARSASGRVYATQDFLTL